MSVQPSDTTGNVSQGPPGSAMMQPPPSQHHTTVILQQPASIQQQNILGPKGGHRDWNSGLFSCFDDVGKCMMAMCCPSCVLSEVSSRLGECCCVTCCVPGGLVAVRTRIRTLGGIRGSICNDCLTTELCYPCTLCQIHRELDYMGI